MKTTYARPRKQMKIIDLDKLSKRKDTDFILTFGGAELIIQYRTENALRDQHPFIDIVVAPDDNPMLLDVVNDDGDAATVEFNDNFENKRVAQLLLGQRVD